MGYLLTCALVSVKTGPAKSSKRIVGFGSLVTPILEHLGIEVLRPSLMERCSLMDSQYLSSCGFLVLNFLVYCFQDRQSQYRFIQLPQEQHTTLSYAEDIEFLPPPKALCARLLQPTLPLVRHTTRQGLAPDALPSYYDPSSQRASTSSQPWDSSSPFLVPDFSEFDLLEFPGKPITELERQLQQPPERERHHPQMREHAGTDNT